MTKTQLVEIKPRELKFTFEVKKQSSCAVRLANITDQYVAFKVKTTSPKKYCVRPNIGVIKPKSTYDFTVLMQAQRAAPSDMLCKDKFLIQTTVVPFGASEEEITPSMFNKDGGKYIEECKLRVILVSPPQSPVLQPANGISKLGAPVETSLQQEKFPSGLENLPSPVLQPANGISKLGAPVETSLQQEKFPSGLENFPSPVLQPANGISKLGAPVQTSLQQEKFPSGLENLPPAQTVVKSKDVKLEEETGEPRLGKVLDDIDWIFAKKTEFNTVAAVESVVEDRKDAYFVAEAEEPSLSKTVEDIKLNSPEKRESITSEVVKLRDLNLETAKLLLTKDVEELKSKINSLDSQLVEAESIIAKLEEEKRSTVKDIKMLKLELGLLRTKVVGKRAQAGFPPLFLCMVALICLTIGYLLRA